MLGGVVNGEALRPSQLVETVVVDAEVMRYLVDDRTADLVDYFLDCVAVRADRPPVNGDPVGQYAGIVAAARQRHSLVEPEQPARAPVVLDDDCDIAHQPPQLFRDAIQGSDDHFFELLRLDLDHAFIVGPPLAKA